MNIEKALRSNSTDSEHFNKLLKQIQDKLGQPYGDIAAHHFSNLDWKTLPIQYRRESILYYILEELDNKSAGLREEVKVNTKNNGFLTIGARKVMGTEVVPVFENETPQFYGVYESKNGEPSMHLEDFSNFQAALNFALTY